MSWTFRPSALQRDDYSKLSIKDIIDHYIRDNDRALHEGVTVPPPPVPSTTVLPLRTIQWNIQAFTSPTKTRNSHVTEGMLRTICSTRPDVIVLNEYHWCDEERNPSHAKLEGALHRWGYTHCRIGTVLTPTLIATSWPVLEYHELVLSVERSALCLKVAYNDDTSNGRQRTAWIVGTHLDAFCGDQRREEMLSLLEGLETLTSHDDDGDETHHVPIIIMGDFNQQRTVDYSIDEWRRIQESMDVRKVCQDDGVSKLLERYGLNCVFDRVKHDQRNRDPVRCNWETIEPPSTHWSGTAIDYSYSNNVPVHGIYISPAGFSDHRMTVCDWNLPRSGGTRRNRHTVSLRDVVGLSRPVFNILDESVNTTISSTVTMGSTGVGAAVVEEEEDDMLFNDEYYASSESSSWSGSDISPTL